MSKLNYLFLNGRLKTTLVKLADTQIQVVGSGLLHDQRMLGLGGTAHFKYLGRLLSRWGLLIRHYLNFTHWFISSSSFRNPLNKIWLYFETLSKRRVVL
jgi:hypothetical protein